MDAGLTSIFSKCRALSRVAILVVCFDLSVCSALASRLVSLFSFVQFFLPIFFHHVSLYVCSQLHMLIQDTVSCVKWANVCLSHAYDCIQRSCLPSCPQNCGWWGLLSTLYPQGEAGVWHPAWVPNPPIIILAISFQTYNFPKNEP